MGCRLPTQLCQIYAPTSSLSAVLELKKARTSEDIRTVSILYYPKSCHIASGMHILPWRKFSRNEITRSKSRCFRNSDSCCQVEQLTLLLEKQTSTCGALLSQDKRVVVW